MEHIIDGTDEQQMNECIDEQIDNEQNSNEQIEDFEVEESDIDESMSAKSIKWFYCSMGDN